MDKVKNSHFKIYGGYYNISMNTKALIGTSDNGMNYFFPINEELKKVVFPCKEISDETLNGFNNSKDEFIGFNGYSMKKMSQTEFESFMDYLFSYDPFDIPDNW